VTTSNKAGEPGSPAERVGVDSLEAIAGDLVEEARSKGIALTGDGGLLPALVARVLETGLQAELTDHLGYEPHATEGRGSGNSRNGSFAKTVTTEIGEVPIRVLGGTVLSRSSGTAQHSHAHAFCSTWGAAPRILVLSSRTGGLPDAPGSGFCPHRRRRFPSVFGDGPWRHPPRTNAPATDRRRNLDPPRQPPGRRDSRR
jgi:hypothetical protein